MLGEFDYSDALTAQRRLPVAMYFSSFVHDMRMPESPSPAHEYWQRTLRLTGWLLVVWFAVTFIAVFFARPLADFVLFGFPVSFYISAQGALLAYGAIVWFYARRMNRWDEVYEKQAETEDDSPDRNEP